MLFYAKYIAIWLIFMAVIAVIALLVPRIAAHVEKWRGNQSERENPAGDTDGDTDGETDGKTDGQSKD